jgi:threonine dehydrogenase-like Zn-dependent dehydrogenase
MTNDMLAGVYRGRAQVRAERVAVREPRAGQVRLRVEACGLCGSDLHIYHSEPDRVRAGMTLGHEIVGTVDAVGEEVDRWRVGDRATVEPLLSCGRCEQCAAGFDNRCREYALLGLHRPGGFAERVIVDARRLYAIPPSLDRRVAALAEPVAVCVHGLRLGRFDPSEPLIVLGAGSIGILTVAVARLWGASEIAITARHAHQARIARELGATAALDPASIRAAAAGGTSSAATNPRAAMSASAAPNAGAATNAGGATNASAATNAGAAMSASAATNAGAATNASTVAFPLVVETVGGHADTLLDASVAVAPGGRVLVLGVFQDLVRLDPWPLLFKEASLTWSLCYTRPAGAPPSAPTSKVAQGVVHTTPAATADFDEAVRLLAAHPEVFARVLTHQVPLAEIDRAFALADDKSSGAVKVTVIP